MKKKSLFLVAFMLMVLLAFGAAAESALISSTVEVNADGSVDINWEYSGSKNPVSYILAPANDPSIDHTIAGRVVDSSYTLYQFIPGYEYELLLLSESFDILDAHSFTIPQEDFVDLKTMKFTHVGVVNFENNKFREGNIVKNPTAQKLSQDIESGAEYRFYIKMTTPSIAKGERTYNALLAVTAPNGFTETVADEFVLENDEARTYWTWFPLPLTSFYENSALTSGSYRFSYYLDGKLVDVKEMELR